MRRSRSLRHYGLLQTNGSGGGNAVAAFANLYWDVNPGAYNGTDIGFELSAGHQNFFIPGGNNIGQVAGITVALSGDGSSLEFSIPNSFFTTQIPGLSYYPGAMASIGTEVTLGLSQSFGYSVAGGAGYGADRLGSVTLAGAVPEPAAWGMMIGGIGRGRCDAPPPWRQARDGLNTAKSIQGGADAPPYFHQ